MLNVTFGFVTAEKSKGTTQIEAAVHQLLDYCATHPNAKIFITPVKLS